MGDAAGPQRQTIEQLQVDLDLVVNENARLKADLERYRDMMSLASRGQFKAERVRDRFGSFSQFFFFFFFFFYIWVLLRVTAHGLAMMLIPVFTWNEEPHLIFKSTLVRF